jgi:hypothetical protein
LHHLIRPQEQWLRDAVRLMTSSNFVGCSRSSSMADSADSAESHDVRARIVKHC